MGVELHFFSCPLPPCLACYEALSGLCLDSPCICGTVRSSLSGSTNQCRPFSSRPAGPVQRRSCHQSSPDDAFPLGLQLFGLSL